MYFVHSDTHSVWALGPSGGRISDDSLAQLDGRLLLDPRLHFVISDFLATASFVVIVSLPRVRSNSKPTRHTSSIPSFTYPFWDESHGWRSMILIDKFA